MKCCDMCGDILQNVLTGTDKCSHTFFIENVLFHNPKTISLGICSKCQRKLIRFIKFEQARNRKGGAMG